MSESQKEQQFGTLETLRILIVDDEEAICQMTQLALAKEAIEAVTALNSKAAWEILEQGSISMMLVDWRLGQALCINEDNLTGARFISKVRSKYSCIPICVLSGVGAGNIEAFIQHAIQAGADTFLPKPFDITSVLAWIATWQKRFQNPFSLIPRNKTPKLESVEKLYVTSVYRDQNSNASKAGQILGITRQKVSLIISETTNSTVPDN